MHKKKIYLGYTYSRVSVLNTFCNNRFPEVTRSISAPISVLPFTVVDPTRFNVIRESNFH